MHGNIIGLSFSLDINVTDFFYFIIIKHLDNAVDNIYLLLGLICEIQIPHKDKFELYIIYKIRKISR